ncbi:putative phd-finger domain-containing protein [Erysiphe neolycopersici]|uniref:Chromatin modification-related protein n=1 Tax=Erysiphe neolycopersici TaxID=212602 RepID=A0A420HYQ0_9PEZI|nr:putative phd-finger domain-containing protein [Erysiphe neolycopersici]
MTIIEQNDAATVLEDWINRVANLPNEVAFMYEEIEQKDKQIAECLNIISKHDTTLQNWVRKNGGHIPNPKESFISKIIIDKYDKAQALQSEKIALAQKCQLVVDKHTRNLDIHIKALQDRGEFPNDADIPSLLRNTTAPLASRTASVATTQSQTPDVLHNRNSSQNIQNTAHSQAPAQPPTSTPTTVSITSPSIALTGRQTRETSISLGNKKQNLFNNSNIFSSCTSVRQVSLGPGNSKVAIPANTVRAGSIGPRAQMKIGPKKIVSYGGKPAGSSRKQKKSGLSRLKRTGNKTSLSPSHDSEQSGAESASIHDEDEVHTPKRNQGAEGNEEMVDAEEDDGADDRKYCTCRSVSYGDMVGCDNPNCEFEWFHWSCVGLKSEPPGIWICPACKAAGFKK